MTERAFRLDTFSLSDMVECASAIRRCGSGASTMDQVAERIVRFLHERLVDADGEPATALVRLFKTHDYGRLPDDLRELADRAVEGLEPRHKCLLLLATAGTEEAWNDADRSKDHRIIPLPSPALLRSMPMISALMSQVGVDPSDALDTEGVAGMTDRAFDVFHVADAQGSDHLPAQEDFVEPYGIASAIGFGGALPSGNLFVVVMFSRVPITRETAGLFRAVGIAAKLALVPFIGSRTFASPTAAEPPPPLESKAGALEQLLDTLEMSAVDQAARLERALTTLQERSNEVADQARIVETLHYVGSALATHLDLDTLISAATDAATAVTGAQFGAFFYNVTDGDGESYMLWTIAGVPRDHFDAFPMPRNTEVFAPTFAGDEVVRSDDITKDPRYGRNPPYHGMPPGHLPVRSYLAVPVVSASGEVLGGLFLGHEQEAMFDARDERLVVGIAGQAATAMDNARLYAAEQEARRAAERTAEQLARLQATTAALAGASGVQQVADVLVTEARAGMDAAAAAFFLVRDRRFLQAIATSGHEPEVVEAWRVVPFDDGLPTTEALRTGEPVLISNRAELSARFPSVAAQPSPNQGYAVVPIVSAGEWLGALSLSWATDRGFTPEDRRFLLALAAQGQQAMERARLAEAERQAAERQRFLSEASRELGATLDLRATVARAARLPLGELGDVATVHLVREGALRLQAAGAVDPDLDGALSRVVGDPSDAPVSSHLTKSVVTGQVQVVDRVTDADLDLRQGADASFGLPGGAEAAVVVLPLLARAGPIGVLTVARSGGAYLAAEVELLQDLAGRVAVAIDNARLHEDRSEVARVLQKSLLPPHLIGIPGLDLDVRYHAMAQGSDLGGDFYDVFRIGQGRWGVLIGDVCGKGVPAASLTALARYTARAAALSASPPSGVLEVVNRAVLEEGFEDRFCTMVTMCVDPGDDGGASVVLANGGHPQPLKVTTDGEVVPVGSTGLALGLFDEVDAGETTVELRPGEALVLYTDGVTEARSPEGRFDADLLPNVLAGVAGRSATDMVEAVEGSVLSFEGGELRDDMAVLVLRAMPTAAPAERGLEFDRRFPAVPASVSMARHELAQWLADRGPGPAAVGDELLLVVTELATNAMRAARTGFHVRVWVERDAVAVELADDGPGFNGLPDAEGHPELLAERGRGLFLLQTVMDECSIDSNEGGTIVRARKHF